MTERESLMRRLQVESFAMYDTLLYLDTHPTDQKALEYYHRIVDMNEETMNQYIQRFGPIDATDVISTDRWTWVDTPWPWEGSAL